MKRTLIALLLIFCSSGCCPTDTGRKQILVKINNYAITLPEFEQQFKNSIYSTHDTPEAKKQFLDFLINRKLILQDAQTKALDRDKDFLQMIESFWEHSLLKLALDKKSQEISHSIFVNDKEVEEAYQELVKDRSTDKTYETMYKQIKWEISAEKEKKALDEWVMSLRAKARIQIDDSLLERAK